MKNPICRLCDQIPTHPPDSIFCEECGEVLTPNIPKKSESSNPERVGTDCTPPSDGLIDWEPIIEEAADWELIEYDEGWSLPDAKKFIKKLLLAQHRKTRGATINECIARLRDELPNTPYVRQQEVVNADIELLQLLKSKELVKRKAMPPITTPHIDDCVCEACQKKRS